jgi:hypothetical protein
MHALLVLALLATVTTSPTPAAPAVTAPAHKVASKRVVVLEPAGGVLSDAERTALTAIVTARVARLSKMEVMSSADLRQMLDLEADKQKQGCDSAGCLAEIAEALDAQLVVGMNTGKLGSTLVLTLSVFDSRMARVLARETVQADSIEQLSRSLNSTVDHLWEQAASSGLTTSPSASPPPPPAPLADTGPSRVPTIVLASGGGLVGVAGVAGLVFGTIDFVAALSAKHANNTAVDALSNPPTDLQLINLRSSHDQEVASVTTWNQLGLPLTVAGVACVAAGAGLVWWGIALAPPDEAAGGAR